MVFVEYPNDIYILSECCF